MTRPDIPDDIQHGSSGWDAAVNLLRDLTLASPYPLYEHTGDETDLEATWPAAMFRNCLIWVDHSTEGWTIYVSNETAWVPFSESGGGGGSGEWSLPPVINPTDPYTLLDADRFVLKTDSTALEIVLPAASAHEGRVVVVKNAAGTTNDITVTPDGTDTIDGDADLTLTPSGGAQLVSDGVDTWHLI